MKGMCPWASMCAYPCTVWVLIWIESVCCWPSLKMSNYYTDRRHRAGTGSCVQMPMCSRNNQTLWSQKTDFNKLNSIRKSKKEKKKETVKHSNKINRCLGGKKYLGVYVRTDEYTHLFLYHCWDFPYCFFFSKLMMFSISCMFIFLLRHLYEVILLIEIVGCSLQCS